ncbi:hypothetical protein HYPGJ_10130 [Hyphomicrobium sp. GJ21]|nr:hypothetical protein HYPGJ_10130 [Hyphomicrobium sp. GJ21]
MRHLSADGAAEPLSDLGATCAFSTLFTTFAISGCQAVKDPSKVPLRDFTLDNCYRVKPSKVGREALDTKPYSGSST